MVAEMMPNPLIASIMREIMTASRMRDHAEVMRTIKGPCFEECKDGRRPDGTLCKCGYFALTEPHEKIEPEQRPNVPPRMM